MRLIYGSHSSFERHDTGPSHPERPERLQAVDRGIHFSGVEFAHVDLSAVDRQTLTRVHPASYVDEIERFCLSGGGFLDADTVASVASWEAALRAAGAGPAAVESLLRGEGDAAFLAVRPPGHHAESARAMGFCLFNNVAVTARLLADSGERVAILDWDVHHGNGTQTLFWNEPEVLYISVHEFPLYPGTGWVDEVGEGPGVGTVLNLPLPAGTAGDLYREAFEELVVPVISGFSPTWLLVSSGYDAHAADPLARLRLLESDYGAMAAKLVKLVDAGRTIFLLEGGYDLQALESSVKATVLGLAGVVTADESDRPTSPQRAWLTLSLAREQMETFYTLS
ncbi:MAG: histone deacetylase family protein [Acidimicrobiia bacterium]